jgi:hypothetical protein
MKRIYIYTNKQTKKVAEGTELEYIISLKTPAIEASNNADQLLKAFIAQNGGTISGGLVPDHIRVMPEYLALNSAFNKAFAHERNVNKWVNDRYKVSVKYSKK